MSVFLSSYNVWFIAYPIEYNTLEQKDWEGDDPVNQKGQSESLGNRIAELRKKAGFTQEQLADKLGLTYQAVSKWENDLSCPDILLLPDLACLLGISIDDLLGRPSQASATKTDATWPDDQTLRLVLYRGHQLLRKEDGGIGGLTFTLHGEALNVVSQCSIMCDSISNGATAGGDIKSGDICGDVRAGGTVKCGDVTGVVQAVGDVACGDVNGSLDAGGAVQCGDIGGNATANGVINCGDVGGNATADGDINCGDVGGNASANGNVNCGDVGGVIRTGNGPQ